MKKVLMVLVLVLVVSVSVAWTQCITIKDGILTYSAGHYLEGQPLQKGFDPYGYNYQAHLFNGYYANVYLGPAGFPPYEGDAVAYLEEYPQVVTHWAWPHRDVILLMKWNDAWLSNKDCNFDGILDRSSPVIGSGAWETNHQSGVDVIDGEECHWTYFVKIAAVPEGAELIEGVWFTEDGIEIGPVIWGSYAYLLQVYNSPCEGAHGIEYLSPAGPGFGKFAPKE